MTYGGRRAEETGDVWGRLAERYEEAYGLKTASPCWPRARRLAGRVDGRILDLACGAGFDLALFPRGVGIDSSPGMLAAARRRTPPSDLVLGDVRALPFRPASLAGAFSCLALIHLTKRELAATLAELRVLLWTGAPIEMAFFAGTGEKDTTFSHLDDRAIAHYSYYQPAELVRLFEAAGFDGVTVEHDVLNEPTHSIECLCVSAIAAALART
jgi:SAM-dependent methyltransferase